MKKSDNYEKGRRTGARLQIEQLVNTLQGDEEDRFEHVFGEDSNLLPGFLEAAEERRLNGIVENPRCRANKKRSRSEPLEDDDDDDEGNNIDSVDNVMEEEGLTLADDAVDFPSQIAYDQNITVARDLHSWRQQSHYWR